MKIKKLLSVILSALMLVSVAALAGCGSSKEKVIIYTAAEDYRIDHIRSRLSEQFPDYDVTIEYMSTGELAAKLISEGKSSACDIIYDLEYNYLLKLDKAGNLADVSGLCDEAQFTDDTIVSKNYVPTYRNGGAIILNTDVLKEKGLAEPESYDDLLKPEYKGLISMPNPKSSGTGYMFYKSLVNAWGEEKALKYFDSLTENILSYTSSGSGPINSLIQKEVAIGLGMTPQAVTKINEGRTELKIKFFDEGSPYCLYGQSIIKGKESKEAVKEVFKFLSGKLTEENTEKFCPEKIYKDKNFSVDNFPSDIKYADMSGDTPEAKEDLLAKWKY
ncbi:MAG: extracellular solute-binding protein [Acutalibacteraceae bacterium]